MSKLNEVINANVGFSCGQLCLFVAGRDGSRLLALRTFKRWKVGGLTQFLDCVIIILASFLCNRQAQQVIHWSGMLLEAM